MSVSGNKEMGVKPSVGQFSEYSAGIPIKKRRFPFIWSPSEPTEDLPSLPSENESEQKGISSMLNGSTVSNDSIIAVSSNPSDVLSSSNTSGVVASSSSSGINGDGLIASLNACSVPASLNDDSFAASSNASSVATSSTTISVGPNLNAGSVAASSNPSYVATSSAVSVAASLNAGSVAASSNASGVALSSTAISFAASSNAGSVAASSNASGVATSSTAISVAARLNAGSIAAISNASGVAMSSTAISVTAASNISDASVKSVPDKEKTSSDDKNGSMVQGNTNLLRVKGNDSLTLSIGKDIYSRKNVDGKFRSLLHTISGNPGLSLGLSECLSPMAGGNNGQGFQSQEKTEPVSFNISLSRGECCIQRRSTDVQPNINGANKLMERTNWDLNTTMDSWEGAAIDDGMSKNTIHTEDIKPLICSAGMTATSMPTQQQVIEGRANLEMSSMLSSQQYGAKDSLHLGLRPYLLLNSNEKPSGSSAKVDLGKVVANISSPGEPLPIMKPTMANLKPVKSEPLDESVRSNSGGVEFKPMGFSRVAQVKCELMEKCIPESLKSSTLSILNSVDARSLKPEPVCESMKEKPERMEGSMNQSDDQMLSPLDTTTVPTATDSSLYGGASSHVEHFIQAKETESASKMISSVGLGVNESIIVGKINNSTSQSKKVEDPDHCRLKSMEVQLPDSRETAEGSVSDEERINLSGDVLEEDSYGFDYDESDDNREFAAAMDIEHDGRAEDDFEDGEVREPVENTELEVPMCERQVAGSGNTGDTGYENSDFVVFVGDNNPSSSSFKENETRIEDPGRTSNDNTNACIDTSVSKDSSTEADKEDCLQESSAVEIPNCQIDKKATPRKSIDVSGNKDTIKGKEGEQTSIQATDTSQGTSVTIAQGTDDAKKTDSEGKSNSVLPKAKAFSNGDDAREDVDNGGGRSRIINLSRASNLSSPGRTRPISGRTLQSEVERERLPDVALEGDKFHRRGRDEAYADSSHRFSRERHHIQPSRNNRISFMRGRGRISSRIDTLRGDQDSECNFASEFYNGPPQFRVVRHKYASAVSDADHKFSSYNNGQDGAYFGTGRGGRKMLSDDSPIFPNLYPRRWSPGGRDGHAGRGLQMVRRVSRNLSPSRCIGEDGSELVGLRHMRGFADDNTDPIFARCQPSFEGLDCPFVRGNGEFASVQRRGPPRTRSKSPTRPRRRSSDGFGGPLELPHRRSSPIYRMESIRSPDRPCFTGEMVIRRHGSPPYLSRPSNDLRVLDPGRDHGHPRPGISNRSPSGRILLRNSRRMDLVDPRESNDGDDYFGGPMPSGRFHELGTDGNADERRRYSDRRGPVRPFRPPYSGADNENFHFNAEGGPRSFRFCPKEDPELNERGNMREREFDRRIKNRAGNAPRRTRNIEEREGNFRPGGQVWHDDGFDDMSQVKRKRF